MAISRTSFNNADFSESIEDDSSVEIEIVTSTSSFLILKQTWNKLLTLSQEEHPFLLWEWQYNWWEVFADSNDQLNIIAVYQHNRIIGLAPFYLKKLPIGTSLRFIGEGEHRNEAVCTHYPDILCSVKHQDIVINEIANHLNRHKRQWDYAHFSFVLNNSLLHKLKTQLNLIAETQKSLGSRYLLKLPGTIDEFYGSLGKSTRKNFRSKRNRMEKQASLNLTQLDLLQSREASLKTLANLHRARQTSKDEKSVFDQVRFVKFHQQLIQHLEDTEIAEMKALKHGDDIVAVAYNYIVEKNVYSYASGFKSRDDKRFSPMLVFDSLEIESLIKKGFNSYDFLSAANGVSYKKHYGCEEYPVNELCWFKPTIVALTRYTFYKIRMHASKQKTKFFNFINRN